MLYPIAKVRETFMLEISPHKSRIEASVKERFACRFEVRSSVEADWHHRNTHQSGKALVIREIQIVWEPAMLCADGQPSMSYNRFPLGPMSRIRRTDSAICFAK